MKNRVVFTTTLDKDLLRKTRIRAAELGFSGANDVIEMALTNNMEHEPAENLVSVDTVREVMTSANFTVQDVEKVMTGIKTISTEKSNSFSDNG